MSKYFPRIKRYQEVMKSEGVYGTVIAPTNQMKYLTGWAESGHERLLALFVPATGEPTFIVPSLNAAQALHNPAGITDVRGWDDTTGWNGVVADLLSEWEVDSKRVAIDDELDSIHLLGIQGIVPNSPCEPAGRLMAQLREVKADDELSSMIASAKVTDEVYQQAILHLRTGMTEVELRDIIAAEYKSRGTSPDFGIICFGANSAIPHHRSGNAKLLKGDIVLIDIGCTVADYCSDITRTVSFCKPSNALSPEIYNVVNRAYHAAFQKGAIGVTCQDVDTAARDVITEAGYAEYFIHRTGHGIGLSGHEPPYIVQGNLQLLKPGMCFSDEPGIYLEGQFGVRIENCVYVTNNGLKSFNAIPPSDLQIIQ